MDPMGITPATNYDTLHRHVIVDVAGLSEPLLHQEIQKAAAKFIRLSQCWRETLTLGSLATAATFNFTYPTNGGTGPSLVTYAAYPGIPLRWVKIDGVELHRNFYRIDSPAKQGDPYTITMLNPYDSIGSGTVTGRLWWRLRFDADPAPEWIYAQYGQEIANLCRGALLTMIGKPWSSKDGQDVLDRAIAAAHRVLAEANLSDPIEFKP
jgi:hypothetical protein